MNETELVAALQAWVKANMNPLMESQPVPARVSVDWGEALARKLGVATAAAVLDAWKNSVEQLAIEVGLQCPGCGKRRKCKTRSHNPMQVQLLGQVLSVPKLYLECDCGAPGVSITRLLTGLKSGATSAELELAAGYSSSDHSYGKASRDLEVHYGRAAERTAVRRLALKVEAEALRFVEGQRVEALRRVECERRSQGVPKLMLQGDGGTVRTGMLAPCKRGDPGYGKKTARTGRPCRKRDTQYRELITLDARQPGESAASALDVVVPVVAPPGERSRRMLALAARKGLGANTKVYGLGDMGSELAESFDEAFVDYESQYSADWKHTCDYVDKTAAVVEGLKPRRWATSMKNALWHRRRSKANALLEQAAAHRVADLPEHAEKCPVAALRTYVTNNWQRLQARRFKEEGLDYVSARAEAQVRDRTKARFAVAGAWRQENLEGKATVRAIVADGRWVAFREHYLRTRHQRFDEQLCQRLRKAVAEHRLHVDCVTKLGVDLVREVREAA